MNEEEFLEELDRRFGLQKPKFPWRSVILNGIGALVGLIILLIGLWMAT